MALNRTKYYLHNITNLNKWPYSVKFVLIGPSRASFRNIFSSSQYPFCLYFIVTTIKASSLYHVELRTVYTPNIIDYVAAIIALLVF